MLARRNDVARRSRRVSTHVFLLCCFISAKAVAFTPTFTVVSTDDTGGSTCAAGCTLRQAITAANASPTGAIINFNISGAGLHTIAPATPLPTIVHPVTIDGHTQSGTISNSSAVGTNAVLKIEINGASATAGASGLTLGAGSAPSTIKELIINGFKDPDASGFNGHGIVFNNFANIGGAVKGCFIGTDATGSAAKQNDGFGILLFPLYSGVTIGGPALADRNLISGNGFSGIYLSSANNIVQGSLIGTAHDGVSLIGNANGVLVLGNGNQVGGTGAGAGNVIAGNQGNGVRVTSSATGVRVQENAISANGQLGIDLSSSASGAADGVTANDSGDSDTGANGLQNFPVLTSARLSGGILFFSGTLNSAPNRTFRIEFFASESVDPSGHGEGQRWIDLVMTIPTNANGDAVIGGGGGPLGVTNGEFITATATDTTTNETSEFSNAVRVVTDTTVTNTNDSGPGSLRDAITNANNNPGIDVIDFAIPGAGVHTIHLLTELPTITDTVTIDGYTQAGATPNTLDEGDDAVIAIRLDGATLTAVAPGLGVCAQNSLVKGMSITGFMVGVNLGFDSANSPCAGGFSAALNSAVEGSNIGLLPDGLTSAPNLSGVQLRGPDLRVGGGSPSRRNLISGNLLRGIFVGGGFGATIDRNYIGTDASGQIARGNGGAGILLTNDSSGTLVGTATRNHIAYNADAGIIVSQTSVANRIAANDIHDNANLGIDLGAAGVTPNDPDDADSGPNNLQNFPESISVSRTATGLSISGTLDRPATATSLNFSIGVYASATCDPSGFGEGEQFLGKFDFVSADASIETFTNRPLPTTAPLPVGTQITLTATDPAGNTSEFSHCAALDSGAQTFVVNSALDTDDGNCTAAVGGCTLREAINASNARVGGDTIAFNIPGGGVHVISPTSALPTITDPVTIDGYSQSGALPNTLAEGDNAMILIQVDGVLASINTEAFYICASDTTVRGLSITRFEIGAIRTNLTSGLSSCNGAFTGIQILGNFIGLLPGGGAAGNLRGGIFVDAAVARIGGTLPSERNILSEVALAPAIFVTASLTTGTTILGNYIGTDPSGTLDRGNEVGVTIGAGASGVIVGGAAPNRIAFNTTGILVRSPAKACDLYANEFFSSGLLAIDLSASGGSVDGPTANDPDDGDSGGNDLQNFPLLASAAQDGPNMHLVGTLDVPAGNTSQAYKLAFYANASCANGARGQGEIYLGYANVNLSGASQEFVIDLPASAPIGSHIAATATSASGTSEFSTCVTLAPGEHIFANGFEL